jgi:hypothetical protein
MAWRRLARLVKNGPVDVALSFAVRIVAKIHINEAEVVGPDRCA